MDLVRLAQGAARRCERYGVFTSWWCLAFSARSSESRARRRCPTMCCGSTPSISRLEDCGLLGLDAGAPIIPLGVVLYSHLKLRLRLRAAGFAVTFHKLL